MSLALIMKAIVNRLGKITHTRRHTDPDTIPLSDLNIEMAQTEIGNQEKIGADDQYKNDPNSLLQFENLEAAQLYLMDIIGKEKMLAKEKIAQPSHWHNVGSIQMQAVLESESVINFQLKKATTVEEFSTHCYEQLDLLAQDWRESPDDEDGYGGATVEVIKNKLLVHPQF